MYMWLDRPAGSDEGQGDEAEGRERMRERRERHPQRRAGYLLRGGGEAQ